jgi:hypothetical protein
MKIWTVLPGSDVPEQTGVLSFMMSPFAGVLTEGAAGGAVSTVKVFVLESTLTFPAASLALAFTLCAPSKREAGCTKLQFPVPSTAAVPCSDPSAKTVKVLYASAVPDILGVLSFVLLPLAGETTIGAAGGVVSTVNVFTLESELTLPIASAAIAFMVWYPSDKAVGCVKVQFPAPLAVVVPTVLPSAMMVTVLPNSAVPV